jgi:PAS domain S-box-containing protein
MGIRKALEERRRPGIRILVVDDESGPRNGRTELLQRHGYDVVAVADGAAALEAIEAQHFDLVITDNVMPKVTGIELINKLKDAHSSLPTILATGAVPEHQLERYPWLRTIDVLIKPFTTSELLSAIKKTLNHIDEASELGNVIRPSREKIPSSDPEPNQVVRIDRSEAESQGAGEPPGADEAQAKSDKAKAQTDRTEELPETLEMVNKKALLSSELRYRRLFESARDGILILNVETGQITDVNPFLVEILGFSKSEMVGKTVGELSPFRDIEPNQAMLERLVKNGYVRYEGLPLETRDNRHIDVEFVCNVYQEGDKKVIQCNIRDITERKRAEDEKRQFNAELEERVAQRTEELEAFSGSVSHDLRAPLRHVIGLLKELREDAESNQSEKRLKLLGMISRATTGMGDLIDDLLAFSRVGKSEIQKASVNLNDLVQETVLDYSTETEERNIEWNIHPLSVVEADRALLRLVFVNLISNAVKFTAGRNPPKIEIGCTPYGETETVIFVRDNGAGFDPNYAAKLFGLFQRLHNQEDFEGTGLGLANVKRIILRHGGRVWAEGVENVGATFYFSLQIAKPESVTSNG